MVALVLAPLDRAQAAIAQVVLERKISGPVIGTTVEWAQEISAPAIVLVVGQAPTARAREPVRCRRAVAVAQIASAIGQCRRARGSVRIIMPLVAVCLTGALLAPQVTAEVPAWEAVG